MKNYEIMQHGTKAFPIGIHNTVCNSGFSLYPHIHREFEFLVMTEGKGVVYIENEKFLLNAGEGLFINSEELHIGIKTDNEKAAFFAVVFAPEIFGSSSLDVIVEKYIEPVISKKICPKRRIDESVVKLLYKVHENPNELKIKSLLFDIWDKCISNTESNFDNSKSKSVEVVKSVMEYIRSNFEKDITLEEMANIGSVSRGYLCREFKNVVHMTPFEYLIQIRIDKGCELLENTDFSIGEVAQKCGFNSFSYFTKIFGEKMGCSPKKYRKEKIFS